MQKNILLFQYLLKKKKKKIDKNGNDKTVSILYKIQFIDSFRFTNYFLSTLVDNLSENIHFAECPEWESGKKMLNK